MSLELFKKKLLFPYTSITSWCF